MGDPGQNRDEGRDRHARIHQGVEPALHLAAPVADRPDLGDPQVGGDAPGGLDVEHAERHLRQVSPHVVEGALHGEGHPGSLPEQVFGAVAIGFWLWAGTNGAMPH